MEIISNGVTKSYKIKKNIFESKKIDIVKDFNYCIKQGEIIGIMGLTGSGKSTILKLLSGRELPSEGKILVDGEENYNVLKNNCEIITDLGNKKLLKNESVYNNLVYFGKKYKLNALDVEKSISTLREIFELDKIINKKIVEITPLDLIKVNITISMLKGVSVLLFDSSLSGLGVIERTIILKTLKRLNKEFKTTIVVSSGDLTDIEKICKRLTIIKDGKIIKDDAFEIVKNEFWANKEVSIIFNKSYTIPKGDFEILENNEYLLRIKIDFKKCDFASLINQFDINTIMDINISNVPLSYL